LDYSLGFKSSFGTNLELGGALSTLEAPLYNKEYALGVFLEGAFNNASRLPLERFTFKKG